MSRPLGPDVNAAESLSLSCQASGGSGVYNYQWTSDCAGDCFLNNRNAFTQDITHDGVRSADTGVYTCTVADDAGNNGSNSAEFQVVGKCLF